VKAKEGSSDPHQHREEAGSGHHGQARGLCVRGRERGQGQGQGCGCGGDLEQIMSVSGVMMRMSCGVVHEGHRCRHSCIRK
jgi:hypothetical protein